MANVIEARLEMLKEYVKSLVGDHEKFDAAWSAAGDVAGEERQAEASPYATSFTATSPPSKVE